MATNGTAGAIQWLLEGDPAIRWQTLRDLVGAGEGTVERERRRVARDGWGARLLARQDAGGAWARGRSSDSGLYSPKWTSTTYTLLLLRDFGLGPLAGTFGVDLAMAAVFDHDALLAFVEENGEDYQSWIEEHVIMRDWQLAGTIVCEPAGVEVPYFEVAFGDGTYNVYTLQDDGETVGLEAVFLEDGAPYPFGQ